MKLNDKRFWKFELMMLLACIICCALLYAILRFGLGILFFDWLWLAFICPPFLLGGVLVWKISQKSHWKRLAVRQLLAANSSLFAGMAIFCIGRDEMTIGYAFMFAVFCVLASVLPVLVCCYFYKRN